MELLREEVGADEVFGETEGMGVMILICIVQQECYVPMSEMQPLNGGADSPSTLSFWVFHPAVVQNSSK